MSDKQRIKRSMSELDDAATLARMAREKLYAEKHWYAVYVHPQHEFQIHDYLMGIEEQTRKTRRGKAKREDLDIVIDPQKVRMQSYLPVIRQRIKYSDRYVWKEKIQTPGIVFVRCDLNNRDAIFHSPISEYVTGFLNDRVKHHPLPIPDSEFEIFRMAVEAEYAITIDTPTIGIGQNVLVLEGPMKGRVVEVVGKRETVSKKDFETDRLGQTIIDGEGNPVHKHKTYLQFRLNNLLAAIVEIDADKVVPTNAKLGEYDYQD